MAIITFCCYYLVNLASNSVTNKYSFFKGRNLRTNPSVIHILMLFAFFVLVLRNFIFSPHKFSPVILGFTAPYIFMSPIVVYFPPSFSLPLRCAEQCFVPWFSQSLISSVFSRVVFKYCMVSHKSSRNLVASRFQFESSKWLESIYWLEYTIVVFSFCGLGAPSSYNIVSVPFVLCVIFLTIPVAKYPRFNSLQQNFTLKSCFHLIKLWLHIWSIFYKACLELASIID